MIAGVDSAIIGELNGQKPARPPADVARPQLAI